MIVKKNILFYVCILVAIPFLTRGQQLATVRGQNVNVRDCAGLDCDVLFQVQNSEKCSVLFNKKEENILGYGINSWYKIDYDGKEGFIYGAFLDFVSDDIEVTYSNSNGQLNSLVLGNEVNARVCAGLACKKAFQLNEGDEVQVLGKTNDYYIDGIGAKPWYEVSFKGQKGFVYGYFVDCNNCDFQNKVSISSVSNDGTIIGDAVNIRTCRSTQCEVAYRLDIGDKCTVENTFYRDSNGNKTKYPWYEVTFNNQTGFVYGQFFSVSSSLDRNIRIRALVVGVTDYSKFLNTSYGVSDLAYPVEDAKRIYQFLRSPEGGNLRDNEIKILRNAEATRDNIIREAKKLFLNANPNDLIIVYFSGHGGPNYFVAHDQPLKYDDIKQVIEASPAKRRLCVADACYSGTWSDNASALSSSSTVNTPAVLDDKQLERLYYDALSNSGNGIALFMSSRRNEISIELPHLGQGLFTHYYIKGLRGAADANKDRIVNIQELYNYVNLNVSQSARRDYNHTQNPTISGYFDGNMPIGIVR